MRTKLITPEIKEEIKKCFQSHKTIMSTVSKVNKLLGISLTKHNVCDIFNELKSELQETGEVIDGVFQEINEEIEEHRPYEIDGLFYILEHKGLSKKYKIKIETVDLIFKDYSKHGNNLSGEEILKKYELKPEVWSMIKTKLRLYKASDVISPYTAENISPEQLDVKIEEAIDENLSRTKDKMVNTHERRFKEEAKKAIKIVANFEYQLSMLEKVLEGYKPKELNFTPVIPKNNDQITVLFSDLHIGKKNTQDIERRIHTMTNDLMFREESVINIIGLGDYVETIVEGGMHPGQVEGMEGVFGFDLIMKAVGILENMFIDLYKRGKILNVYGISGNHDRLTPDNKGDLEKTGGIIVYEMIKRGLQNLNIQIEYFRKEWNNIDLNDFNYIINHGTKQNTKMNMKQILWEYGKQNKHNIIAFGDKHHSELNDVADNATKIIVPALAGPGEYDQRMMLSSYPGYVIVEKNQDGLPNTLFRRLK